MSPGQSISGEWPSSFRQARYGGLHLRKFECLEGKDND